MIEVRGIKEVDLPGVREVYKPYYENLELDERMQKVRDAIDGKLEVPVEYVVALIDGKAEGIIGFKVPAEHLMQFTKTERPIELYSFFVKERVKGIGRELIAKMENITRMEGYSEVVLFSAARWKDGWGFYDAMGYERVGNLDRSSGQAQIFRKAL